MRWLLRVEPLPCAQLESEVEVNCKQFGDSDDIAVSWVIDSTNDIITIQICGCVLVSPRS